MHDQRDLFGEVPVTWPEVFAWLEAVAGIPRESPRAEHYVRAWNVPAKIARAKIEGWFHDAVAVRDAPPPTLWHAVTWRH